MYTNRFPELCEVIIKNNFCEVTTSVRNSYRALQEGKSLFTIKYNLPTYSEINQFLQMLKTK